jgi:hypothetical protein
MERPTPIPQHIWDSFSDESRTIVGAIVAGLEEQIAELTMPPGPARRPSGPVARPRPDRHPDHLIGAWYGGSKETGMFDWGAAEEVLFTTSKDQVARFLGRVDCDDLYGLGYFCDPIEGVMLVANTRRFLATTLGEYVERFGPTDEETFRWDIGNWEYPAGLALSAEEQMEFDATWEKLGRPISDLGDEPDQEALEGLCARVLERLWDEGVFWAAQRLEGFVVLGPDDRREDVLVKKRHLDRVLSRRA